MNIFNYNNFTKYLKEKAIFSTNLPYYDRYFDDINNELKTLKNFTEAFSYIKKLLMNITKDNIILIDKYNDNEDFKIKYNLPEINHYITALFDFYIKIQENNEKLYEKINQDFFDGEKMNMEFEIQIEPENFNKFHFPIDLPKSIKNIGLGKKIILASIEKFNHLLFIRNIDSNDLKIAIKSLVEQESNYFSFEKDASILICDDNFNNVKNVLSSFLSNNYDYFVLDKDFYNKYKQEIKNDEFLNKLYNDFFNKYI